jgi:DNA-binding response OmpR family regulator
MEKWVLAVGYNKKKFSDLQQECLKYSVFVRIVSDMTDAISELSKEHNYLLVAMLSDKIDDLSTLHIMRGLTKAPILIMKHQYDGEEKITAIDAGADEYIQWPDTIQEGIASARALIRRYTELNRQDDGRLTILSRGSIFISVDYRKVFVNAQEIQLPRREFDLFYLLAVNPGRVFTQEQLYQQIWGYDYVPTENSLHSCLRRIRRKLEAVKAPCSIQNMRGVGYCFLQEDT